MSTEIVTNAPTLQPLNLIVFVDYWNFQLSCNTYTKRVFQIDWTKLNAWVMQHIVGVIGNPVNGINHVSTQVYTSYNPLTPAEQKYKNWVNSFLSIQSGFNVTILERKRKGNPKCSSCKGEISSCPHCSNLMNNTEEKGVDTRLSVQMLDLAVNNAYDVAVILSHDADMIPAVQFVQNRGKRVVHFAFSPSGFELRKACNHNFDMGPHIASLERVKAPATAPTTTPLPSVLTAPIQT